MFTKPWTADETDTAMRMIRDDGCSLEAVACALCRSPAAVRKHLAHVGAGVTELRTGVTHKVVQTRPLEPWVKPRESDKPDDVRRLVEACRRGPRTLEQLCDQLQCWPARVQQLAQQARAHGYTVEVAGNALAWQAPDAARAAAEQTVQLRQTTGDRFTIAVCSDLHFGSKYCMREQLVDYMRQVYADGARVCVIAGDILDGCYAHGRWELSHHGWDEQARDAFESLPRLDGLHYYAIDGNHDSTFWAETGMVSGERLVDYFSANGRTDLTFCGAREGRLSLRMPRVARPLVIEAWHPRAQKAYALSYQMQKRVEAYAPGTKPDVLVCGHWHSAGYFAVRGIHALSAGCFQSGESAFSRSLVGGVSCGGWSLSWQATGNGTVRRVRPEFFSYYHREDSRAVDVEPAL